jgi:adenosylmethionine-8-amino-7-oxononanoate aminotransferase
MKSPAMPEPPELPEQPEQPEQIDRRHLWHPFTQMSGWEPLVIAAAEGAYLIDTEGRRYLDGVSSLWVNVHGHHRAELDQAIHDQLGKVAHSTLLGLANLPSIELAEALCQVAPRGLSRVFYSDSGSTAVEVALKIAFQCHRHRGDSRRTRFLALENAYHGDTLGSVSVGGIDLFHKLFQPLLFHVLRVPAHPEALERAFAEHGPELCAFILEPLVQGAAGMLLQPPGFLQLARKLCNQHGVLLIADEVATGFGRTGTLFACEQEGISPDLLCLAKGLTGGYLPLAATLATEAIFESFLGPVEKERTFFHGHSYTGNPLACAVALASLRLFEKDRVLQGLGDKIAHFSRRLHEEFDGHPHVREVRQCGLMIGIELQRAPSEPYPAAETIGAKVCLEARRHGVILRPLGPVVVLMPPLCISEGEINLLIDAAARSIATVCGKRP